MSSENNGMKKDELLDKFREWLAERDATIDDVVKTTGYICYNRREGRYEPVPEIYEELCD